MTNYIVVFRVLSKYVESVLLLSRSRLVTMETGTSGGNTTWEKNEEQSFNSKKVTSMAVLSLRLFKAYLTEQIILLLHPQQGPKTTKATTRKQVKPFQTFLQPSQQLTLMRPMLGSAQRQKFSL